MLSINHTKFSSHELVIGQLDFVWSILNMPRFTKFVYDVIGAVCLP